VMTNVADVGQWHDLIAKRTVEHGKGNR